MITIESVHKEIASLRTVLENQRDLIGLLAGYSASVTAQAETLITLQRETLVTLGVEESVVQKRYEQVFGQQLAAARKTLKQAIERNDEAQPPLSGGADPVNN